jgi:hypothetical protein
VVRKDVSEIQRRNRLKFINMDVIVDDDNDKRRRC